MKQISDNDIYLLIKYIKSVLWRVAKCQSYIEEARCLKVNIVPGLLVILLYQREYRGDGQNMEDMSNRSYRKQPLLL